MSFRKTRVKGSILNAIAVYLSDIKILLDFGDMGAGNVICCTPDSVGRGRWKRVVIRL